MPLIDDVKAVCDRLGPLGWADLLKQVTRGDLNIIQSSSDALGVELRKPLSKIDRSFPGFEDFAEKDVHGIAGGDPGRSLLYHALASPRVLRDQNGQILKGFPTIPEIEAVENLIFAIDPKTLAEIVKSSGASELCVAVFATEYRPASDCAEGPNADITFSRTGIARVGTARAKYLPDVRGYWPEDEDNPNAFRVIPVRFTVWLAVARLGKDARVMRSGLPVKGDADRKFWIPIHKLFEGRECIKGLDLSMKCSGRFFNMKLQKVFASFDPPIPKNGPPFIREDLASVVEASELGRLAVLPFVQDALVKPAHDVDGSFLKFHVPPNNGDFAAYTKDVDQLPASGAEVHSFPAYVHARTEVKGGLLIDLNDRENVREVVKAGGYDALLYEDFTGEGWLTAEVPELAGKPHVKASAGHAYVLLSAPDFFPSTGQRELTKWTASKQIPNAFKDQLWAVPPKPLSDTRFPANLQLPASPFHADDDTITGVVGMGARGTPPSLAQMLDTLRASTLPDDAAGEFGPGWDIAVDVLGPVKTGQPHLAAYGLGSPFPEDAKLCAALSTYWPAVAPDISRTMSPVAENPELRGSVAPLTDEEIGQIGSNPWDGVVGPRVIVENGHRLVEAADFTRVDYVRNAVENRFTARLLARISSDEYKRRVLAAARIHFILGEGGDIKKTRPLWFFLSFRSIPPGDPDLQLAQQQGGHVLKGSAYRAIACWVGNDPWRAVPSNAHLQRMPIQKETVVYVSAEDPRGLRKRDSSIAFSDVAAE